MTVVVAKTSDLESCLMLRRIVFIEEQGVSEADERDALDAQAIHFLASEGNVPIGTARVLIKGNIGKIGRVCVLPMWRGQGLGAALILASLDGLRAEKKVTVAMLGAQSHALGFYEKLGFSVIGPEYLDAGISHFDMECPL